MFRSFFLRRRIIALTVFALFAAWSWSWFPASAPDVVFTTIKGEKVSLQSLKGSVVLVNFWAPSCAPCVREMPMLADAYARLHARGLDVIAVAVSYDPPNVVVDYAETRHLPFNVALDLDDSLEQAFGGLRAVPTTFLIGRDGRIAERFDGPLDSGKLQQLLARQLGPG
jgi:peroxiredoxin